MDQPPSGPATRILLVEGTDEKYVTQRLCEREYPSLAFTILNKGGVDKLIPSITGEASRSGLQAIGILLDANEDFSGRWQQVTDRLRRIGINPPDSPHPNGTIIDGTPRKPRVGIWIMPDNEATGELEDFVIQMIPDGDAVWPLSKRYIDEIPRAEQRFPSKKTPRAQLYAWLAAREDFRQMGLAIRAGDLSVDGELCQKFVAWLTKLFA